MIISVSTYVLKTSYMLSNASWEAPTKKNPSKRIDGTFTVHSFSKIRIRYGAPRCFGDLGRMAFIFRELGSTGNYFQPFESKFIVLGI